MRLVVCLIVLFSLQSNDAETSGICHNPHVVEKSLFVMDRAIRKWRIEKYNETVLKEECCRGYRTEKLQPLSCSPVCEPECENSDCMGLNICVCHPGHVMINNSSSTCYDVCDACINGACLSPNDTECSCFHGYQRDLMSSHICDPICSPTCVNASCTAPSVCECFEKYKPHPDSSLQHICVPQCDEECVFGTCTEPGICTCLEGYMNDKDSPSICLPVCNHTCENGDCLAPNICKCRNGFELDPNNPYRCVSQVPENSSLNSCKLEMPEAIKYDKSSDCFLIKEKVFISIPSECSILQTQTGSFCSQLTNSHHCVLNFQCTEKKFVSSNEIHCYLEEGDFEIDSTAIEHIVNATEWTDAVLVIYPPKNFNSSIEIKENITKEWTFQALRKSPVCGSKRFAAEMSECEMSRLISQEKNHINSSFMFWMNVILICGFLLLVLAGVGGFLWARHRRLNNPLNYREDMMHGFYTNESFENHPELVSDDDSDRLSDAPL